MQELDILPAKNLGFLCTQGLPQPSSACILHGVPSRADTAYKMCHVYLIAHVHVLPLQGSGRATALLLAKKGYNVVVTARQPDRLKLVRGAHTV